MPRLANLVLAFFLVGLTVGLCARPQSSLAQQKPKSRPFRIALPSHTILMRRAVEDFHLRLHGYGLMDNHYHLLVETPKGGLNRALRYLNGVYTHAFNRRHRRICHLFQGDTKQSSWRRNLICWNLAAISI